jgi:maltose O-acetyltransferase
VIRPPFHCDYGFKITLGADVFLNFSCIILDVVAVPGAASP